MQTFLSLILAFGMAAACAYYSQGRGRRPAVWFGIGLLLGLIGLILLFIMPVVKRKDPSVLTPATPQSADKPQPLWYYLNLDNQPLGPMSLDALKEVMGAGTIDGSTYVWNENMEGWKPYKEVVPS
jgi:hypothetical protein